MQPMPARLREAFGIPARRRALLALALLLALCTGSSGGGNIGEEGARLMCSPYKELYTQIDADLARWKDKGISLELMQRTIKLWTTRGNGQKGFAAAFIKGKAYVVDKPELAAWVGHHVGLEVIYMQLLLYLEQLFGDLIPDVEFVINTVDRSPLIALDASAEYEPVMRFCKTDAQSDILIPIYHFHMKGYSDLVDRIPQINKEFPWEAKKPVLFGRFSPYDRHIHTMDNVTHRLGTGGKNICSAHRNTTTCRVREHFAIYAKRFPDKMDVGNYGHIRMYLHAGYKYLLHLDGQGLSSRLEQLMPLNSLIFKEQSGYRAFFHHLIKPYEHYVPFWNSTPDDILPALEWAATHDDEARRIAANAQKVSEKYLSTEARACYWFTLFREFAKLLRYTPGPTPGRKYMQYYRPVREFLDTEVGKFEGGRWLKKWVFKP